ncbi:MAG: hypothetical protein RLZZ67_408 [Candidatus Parcubacteria bacterium]|jgi:cobalamin synthase
MTKDILVPAVLVVLLGLLLEPFGFMPGMAVMTVVIAVVAVFAVFALFLWREKGGDEREQTHIQKADRFGFMFGALVLLVAIVVEALASMLSPWLVLALVVMIVAKASALIYQKNTN